MKRKINRVKLYIKDTKRANDLGNKLKERLLKENYIIDDNRYDLAISIGGDGTFLKMIQTNNFKNNIDYVGINAGSLGFLVEFNEIDELINCLNKNNFIKKNLCILKAKIYTNNEIKEYSCLNEFVIRDGDLASIHTNVYINNILLEKYVGDGLIINTPSGSTAYNLSLFGSIIDNDLTAFSLTPLAPINNKIFKSLNNSFIIAGNKKITLTFDDKSYISFITDGKVINIKDVIKIEISLRHNKINTIKKSNYNFVNQVSDKIINN